MHCYLYYACRKKHCFSSYNALFQRANCSHIFLFSSQYIACMNIVEGRLYIKITTSPNISKKLIQKIAQLQIIFRVEISILILIFSI